MTERKNAAALVLTGHGGARARQRGATLQLLIELMERADYAVPVGGGCFALSMSRLALDEAAGEGTKPSLLARLKHRVVLVDERGRVVTTFVATGKRGRRYTVRGTTARGRQQRR